MSYSEQNTLVEFMESQRQAEPLFEFFKYLLTHEDEFTAGNLPQDAGLSFEYQGQELAHLLIDSIAFGIFWEQAAPSEYRDRPIEDYFETPNALASMNEIVEAQPHAEIANFFRYMKTHVGGIENGELTPPPALYNGANITKALRHGMFFGIQWEIWNADNLETKLEKTLTL